MTMTDGESSATNEGGQPSSPISSSAESWCFSLAGVGVAGVALGYIATALPTSLRVFWLLAVVLGGVSSWSATRIAKKTGVKGTVAAVVLSIVAAMSAVGSYAHRSIDRFAELDAAESDESRAARAILGQLDTESPESIPIEPTERWLIWRTRAFGSLDSPVPQIIAGSEVLACLLTAAAVGWFANRGEGQ